MTGGGSVEVARYEPTDRFPIVTLVGVETREDAEALRGEELHIAPDDRRDLGPDEFWPDQLEGAEVRTTDGSVIGSVTRVEIGLSQDRLVVDSSGQELLIPLVRALVPEVDPDAGWVVVDLPPGFTPED